MFILMLFVVCFTKYFMGDEVEDDEMDRTCSTHRRDEKCVQNYGLKT